MTGAPLLSGDPPASHAREKENGGAVSRAAVIRPRYFVSSLYSAFAP